MDNLIFDLIGKEEKRQAETLMLIPSENYTYPEVRKAVGSVLMHKYAEGYPGKRYYQGMEFVDQIENLAIERAKKLFSVPHVNVQPYSGSPANMAVYFALLEPGDTIMGLSLSHGGHLTHGHPKITFSGKYFKSIQYEMADMSLQNPEQSRRVSGIYENNCIDSGSVAGMTREKNNYFDFGAIRKLALENKPKIIVVGTTAFPRILDWKKFSEIAEEVGAYLLADISHIAGLVAGGAHPSPVPYVHIVTTTTHKTLRGPRGALVMVTQKGIDKNSDLPQKINKAVFPGLQGGPHLHTIAGIAIALRFAQGKPFRDYAKQIVKNAKALSESLTENGFNLVTGGTDNHLMVIDLRNMNIDGKTAAVALEESGIVVNANTIPNDPNPPYKPSGIRLGTPAVTTRGMKEEEMKKIAEWIKIVVVDKKNVKEEVKELCKKFPINF